MSDDVPRDPVPGLREYLCANLHDGDEGGLLTIKVSDLLTETCDLVGEWLLVRAVSAPNAPNARKPSAAVLIGAPRWGKPSGGVLADARLSLAALKAAAGGGRYVVIDTEDADGDGTVWGLEPTVAPSEVERMAAHGFHPYYRLTQPGDGG